MPLIELVGGTMHAISARLESRRNYGTTSPTTLCGRNAGLDLKFLNGIGIWEDRDLPKLRFVVIYSVKGEIVVGGARTVSCNHRTT